MQRGELQPNVSSFDALSAFSGRFWLFVVLTGIGAGLGGGLLMKFLHAVQHLAWRYQSGTFLEGVQSRSAGWRVLVLFGAGVVVGVGRWFLRQTGGQGGEITEAIWFRAGSLPGWRTFAGAVLSISVVGLGASIGREGALKQAGAGIASWLGGRLPPAQRRLLVACGAGAGMAAAYNVPFGGALFALEVLLGELALPLVGPALTASFIAVVVSWTLLPDRPTYTLPQTALAAPLLVWGLVVGPLFGLASVVYVRLITWAEARKPEGWRLLLVPVVVFTLLGLLAIEFPQVLGNGKDVVQLAFTGEVSLGLLLALPWLKVLATTGCLGSGTPGGLFTPTLSYGAMLGGLIGYAWGCLWPGAAPGSYALVGAAAVLAAATQGPLSSVVLLLELTRRLDPLMVPALAAITGAVLVARAIDPTSVYSGRLDLGKSAAVLAEDPLTGFRSPFSRECAVVSAAVPLAQLAPRLLALTQRRRPLYVVDERGRLLGEIDPSRLAHGEFPAPLATAGDLVAATPILDTAMTADQVEHKFRESGHARLPVVDSASRKLIGVVSTSGDFLDTSA
jgi:CIC family chloride channel protein